MAVQKRGHIKIARKAFADDKWWLEKRVYSKWEAFVDMIQLAQHEPREFVSTKFGTIKLERGELVLSQRKMAERWGWGRQSVRSFTESRTFTSRLATQRETNAGTVYLIVNYDLYQSTEVPANPPSNPANNPGLTQDQPTSNPRTSIKAVTTTTSPASGEAEAAVLKTNHRKPKASPKFPDYSREARERLHKEWSMRKGTIGFPRYVAATGGLFPTYTLDQVSSAQALAIGEAKAAHELRFLTPETFAQNIVDLVERCEKDPVSDGWLTDWSPRDAGLTKRVS